MSSDAKTELFSKYYNKYSKLYPLTGLALGIFLSELYLRRSGASEGLLKHKGKNALIVIGAGLATSCLFSSTFNREALNARRELFTISN
jgi:hypothetical protein